MIYSISETLEKADAVATAKEKKEVLREYDSKVLRSVLQYALDPSIKFLLPEGPVAYQKNQLSGIEHLLYSEARLLYLFVEGGNPALTNDKRLKLFVRLLENVAPRDAELLIMVKDKKLPYASITKSLVAQAFPELFKKEKNEVSEERSNETKGQKD